MIEWKFCCLHSSGHLNLTLRFHLKILERHRLVPYVLCSSQIQRVRIRCHFLCAPSLTNNYTFESEDQGHDLSPSCVIFFFVIITEINENETSAFSQFELWQRIPKWYIYDKKNWWTQAGLVMIIYPVSSPDWWSSESKNSVRCK